MKAVKFTIAVFLEGTLALIISSVSQWPFRWLYACLTPPTVLFPPEDACINSLNFALNFFFYFFIILAVSFILSEAMKRVF